MIDDFIRKFGGLTEIAPEDLPEGAQPDSSLGSFFGKFGGPPMISYWFYGGSVEIRFDPVDHIYYLVEELGNLTALLNVSTVSHIVDRSMALIPWCAKVTIEKMLRTIPVQTIATGPEDLSPLIIVPAMTLAEFTRLALEAKSAHKDKLEDAGEVGHMAHFWIEDWIKAGLSGNLEAQAKMLKDIGASSEDI